MKLWLCALFVIPTALLADPGAIPTPPVADKLSPPATLSAGATLGAAETLALVKLVDDRQRNSGDYKSLCYVKEIEKNKEPKLYQVVVYRRDEEDKFMILFTKPTEEAGKGYLKIEKNLWMHDSNTGKWERRTERERIGGTNSRRGDFDESRLSEEYDAVYQGEDKLGSFKVHKIKLTVKAGIDVAYPVISLWVDQADKNVLKREESSLSGKLMRTTFYPKWKKLYSPSKKGDVWIPEEMRIFDELEKPNSTTILIKETDLSALRANMFTKAWMETKGK